MLSVRDVVATGFTPFDKIGEMPADLAGWPGFGQARGREILVFVIRDRARGRDSGAVRTKPVAAFTSRKLAPRGNFHVSGILETSK